MAGAVAAMAGIALPQVFLCPAVGSGAGGGRPARSRVVCCAERSGVGAGEGEWEGKKVAAKLLMPLLAAALVGSSQPGVHAAEWAVLGDADSGYQNLLQKIKERKEQGSESPSASAPAPEDRVSVIQQLKEAAEKARQQREATELKVIQERQQTAQEKTAAEAASKAQAEQAAQKAQAEKEAEAQKAQVQKVEQEKPASEVNVNNKTHGFLPLFLSQLLVLVAAGGFGAALFVVPESSWKQAEQKINEFGEKAVPIIDDLYAKAKPVSKQALEKARETAREAQPYVVKTWEAAKPAAAKAYEASKPLVKEAQLKAAELLKQVQEKAEKAKSS